MITLNDVCHLITDGKHGDCQNSEGSGYYFISCKDVNDGWVDYSSARQITEKDYLDTHKRTQLAPDDTLITNSGTIGRMVFVPNVPETYRTTFQKSVAIIKPNNKKVIPRYLYYYLTKRKAELISWASGTAQKNLLLIDLRNFKIELPAFLIQTKIASILSAYDNLIKNNNRRIKILEEMAQTIYNEWFIKFRFPGHSKIKMVSSDLGEIPQGWGIRKIDDVIDIQSGFAFKSKTFDKNGQYGIVTIKNVQDGRFIGECQSYINEFPKSMPKLCLLKDGDILLSLTGNVGRVCLVYGDNYLLNQRVAKLTPKDSFNSAYVYFSYFQSDFRIRLEKLATGVAQQNLSPIEMGKMKIVYPDDSTLKSYAGVCNPILEDMIILFRKNAILQQSRDLLLPRLISGEIDVGHLDIKTEDIE